MKGFGLRVEGVGTWVLACFRDVIEGGSLQASAP